MNRVSIVTNRTKSMIQFREAEVCRMVKAITWYRDQVTGNDYMWDKYDELVKKLYLYGEEMTPEPYVVCEDENL